MDHRDSSVTVGTVLGGDVLVGSNQGCWGYGVTIPNASPTTNDSNIFRFPSAFPLGGPLASSGTNEQNGQQHRDRNGRDGGGYKKQKVDENDRGDRTRHDSRGRSGRSKEIDRSRSNRHSRDRKDHSERRHSRDRKDRSERTTSETSRSDVRHGRQFDKSVDSKSSNQASSSANSHHANDKRVIRNADSMEVVSSINDGKSPDFSFAAKINTKKQIKRLTDTKPEDAKKITARMKQIQYGKNTIGYDRYISEVSKTSRGSYSEHPRTPDPYADISKRCFDGQIKAWRLQLHRWDPPDMIIDDGLGIENDGSALDCEDEQTNNTTDNIASIRQKRSFANAMEEDNEVGEDSRLRTVVCGEQLDYNESNDDVIEDDDVL